MIQAAERFATLPRRAGLAVACLLVLAGGAAARERTITVEQAIALHLQGIDSGLIVNAATRRIDGLQAFYAARGFRPVWLAGGTSTAAAQILRGVLAGAARDGLDPDAYDAGEFSPHDIYSTARYEVAQSAVALHYLNDLRNGRVAPSEADPDLFVEPRSLDAASTLTALATSDDLARTLDGFAPAHAQYVRLRELLAALRRRAVAGETPPPPVPASGTLEPGDRDPAVVALRARLRAEGAVLPDTPGSDLFDAALGTAVVAFQRRNGLEPDGIVGRATREALNVTPADRIRQVIINMERWRWLPGALGDRYVLVNIADFGLEAVADGVVRHRMKVVVGRLYRRTPVFSTPMTYLEINPYWHVPPTIAVKDLLPKLRKSVALLVADGFRLFDGWGADAAELDPSTIDWSGVSARRFPYKLRQDPGAKNALGQIKFMFPNKHNVYLHDTPARELFQRTVRIFSSGCIRVERPRDLALFVLDGRPEWTPDALAAAIATGRTRKIVLRTPVPVHITYQTAWVDADGSAAFRGDVYGRDADLGKSLFSR